jgi:hypothetical protein
MTAGGVSIQRPPVSGGEAEDLTFISLWRAEALDGNWHWSE